jgi:hypothetical protein
MINKNIEDVLENVASVQASKYDSIKSRIADMCSSIKEKYESLKENMAYRVKYSKYGIRLREKWQQYTESKVLSKKELTEWLNPTESEAEKIFSYKKKSASNKI